MQNNIGATCFFFHFFQSKLRAAITFPAQLQTRWPRFTAATRRIEKNSSRNPGRLAIGLTREGDHKNPRQPADLGGYAPALASHFWKAVTLDARKRSMRLRFQTRSMIHGPVMSRDARASSRHSRSIGLLTPSAPRFITCKYTIVVETSRCPSNSCTVRMSSPSSSKCVAKECRRRIFTPGHEHERDTIL